MAFFRFRVPQNVIGKFYVDDQCIYCDLCVQTAPSVFREEKSLGWASVFHQPSTPAELRLAIEAAECCPTESIGSDGDVQDWSVPSEQLTAEPLRQTLGKPWWKFWELQRPSPNQAMQRTAGRSALPLSMTSTFNLQPHAPSQRSLILGLVRPMRVRPSKLIRLALLAICAAMAGCGSRVLSEVVVDQIDVVDAPFPPGYPSSNPQKIGTLHRGERVYVHGQDYGKDYMYYTVELTNGQRGYVIFSGQWPFRQHDFP